MAWRYIQEDEILSLMHTPTGHSRDIQLLDIKVKLKKARGSLKSLDLLINKERRDVSWNRISEQQLGITLDPPIHLSTSGQLAFHLYYLPYHIGKVNIGLKKNQYISIDTQTLLNIHPRGEGNIRELREEYDKAEIIISFLPVAAMAQSEPDVRMNDHSPGLGANLIPETDEITRICPRFRILLIGKTGVGKSSLINHAFGVTEASVSRLKPGKANINTEIMSNDNCQFVLHDSKGFEPGDPNNVETVQRFIESRNKMPDLGNKLHAIWLCFAIPIAGGRIIETGIEDFLKLKREGKLGKVPIIAVFTKYDKLCSRAEEELDDSACQDEEQTSQLIRKAADVALRENCINPLEKCVGEEVPYIAVSVEEEYKTTLSALIKLTYDNVYEHIAYEASVITAIAQKVNPDVKIDGSIAVGKAKYWKGLASSMNFPGYTLESCLGVIHTDILAVWDFRDPVELLQSSEFKAIMFQLVDSLANQDTPDPNNGISIGLSVVRAIVGLVGIASPLAPIVIPITAGLVIIKWVYDVYQRSADTLRHLMAYIVDLTIIMQIIFWLVAISGQTETYIDSSTKDQVHAEIQKFVREAGVWDRARGDNVLNKIVDLINRNRIKHEDMLKLKDLVGKIVVLGDDEPWDIPESSLRRH